MRSIAPSAAWILFAATLSAAPVIRDIAPHGAQRGKTLQLILKGAGLTPGAKLETTLPASVSRLSPSKDLMKPETELPFLLEVRKDAPVGLYPLRLVTEDGLSNVVLFSVGDLPEVQEKEIENPKQSNGELAAAEAVTTPVVINGTLTDADNDIYSFAVKAGQKVLFEVEAAVVASAVDPALELLDASGKVIARNDDAPGAGIDSRIEHVFAKAGTYAIRIHDSKYATQEQNFYRLKIGSYPYAEAMFPLGWRRGEAVDVELIGGNLAQPVIIKPDTSSDRSFVPVRLPGSLSVPQLLILSDKPEMLEREDDRMLTAGTILNGRIAKPGEVDRYRLAVKPGEQWIFEVKASSTGASRLDALLIVSDKNGKKLESRDDLGGADPAVPLEVPKGVDEVIVSVEDLLKRGGPEFGYRLEARKEAADFLVSLATPFVNVPAGGTAILSARIQRRGYDGPLRLWIQNLPEGFSQAGGTVAPAAASQRFDDPNPRFGVNTSVITITAAPGAKPVTAPLQIVGIADLPGGGRIIREAVAPGLVVTPRGLRARALSAPWLEMPVMLALSKPLPVRLTTPIPLVRIAQGVEFPLNYKVEGSGSAGRSGGRARENIATQVGNLRILQGPPGKTPNSGSLLLSTNFFTPATPWDFLPQITMDVDGRPTEIYGSMVTIDMAPGYQVWPRAKSWKVAPGASVNIAGELYREPTFEGGLVKLEVQDLPDGVECPSVDIAADQHDFKLACQAAASAAKGSYDIRLVSQAPETGRKAKDTYRGPEVTATLRIE